MFLAINWRFQPYNTKNALEVDNVEINLHYDYDRGKGRSKVNRYVPGERSSQSSSIFLPTVI